MAAKSAAHQASKTSSAIKAKDSRSNPDRFAHLDMPRYFTEVSVPGYNVAKSVAKIKRHEQKRRKHDALEREQCAPAAEPIVLTQGRRPGRTAKSRPQDGTTSIQLEL